MIELTSAHEEFLVKAGKWIKAHAQQYCPITAVKHILCNRKCIGGDVNAEPYVAEYIPLYKQIFKDLKKCGLVSAYKGGNVIVIEKAGWQYLASTHPEVIERYRKIKKE